MFAVLRDVLVRDRTGDVSRVEETGVKNVKDDRMCG